MYDCRRSGSERRGDFIGISPSNPFILHATLCTFRYSVDKYTCVHSCPIVLRQFQLKIHMHSASQIYRCSSCASVSNKWRRRRANKMSPSSCCDQISLLEAHREKWLSLALNHQCSSSLFRWSKAFSNDNDAAAASSLPSARRQQGTSCASQAEGEPERNREEVIEGGERDVDKEFINAKQSIGRCEIAKGVNVSELATGVSAESVHCSCRH